MATGFEVVAPRNHHISALSSASNETLLVQGRFRGGGEVVGSGPVFTAQHVQLVHTFVVVQADVTL